jgi:group I intron endonuclease
MGCIYSATCTVTGKKYIGKTRRCMEFRKQDHERRARRGSTFPFHMAIAKYGPSSFVWNVIRDDVPDGELDNIEIESIKREGTKAPFGYNLTDGGDGVKGHTVPCPKEKREKIRKALIGHVVSDESRNKMSESLRTRYAKFGYPKHSPESYRRGADKNRGKPSWAKGKKFSEQHRKNISVGLTGKTGTKWSKERREKFVALRTGVRLSKEHRERVSASIKKWWFEHPEERGRASFARNDMSKAVEAAAQKAKAKTHCKHGHPLSGDNLYCHPSRPTHRCCRECRRERKRIARQKSKEVCNEDHST